MMKLIFPLLLCFSLGFSYQEGDVINQNIQKKLTMNKDKLYIIDFFASWCSSCKKEIPSISIADRQLDQNKFEIIGVDVDKSLDKAISFQEALKSKKSLSFRVVNDPENEIIKEFKPIGMPALFYIRNNIVLKVIYGAVENIDMIILSDAKRFSNAKK